MILVWINCKGINYPCIIFLYKQSLTRGANQLATYNQLGVTPNQVGYTMLTQAQINTLQSAYSVMFRFTAINVTQKQYYVNYSLLFTYYHASVLVYHACKQTIMGYKMSTLFIIFVSASLQWLLISTRSAYYTQLYKLNIISLILSKYSYCVLYLNSFS